MDWKIKTIKIKNFKFFREEFILDVDRRHILIFGENGAGKSSIYWSIYTFLQAAYKSREDAIKYFDSTHAQNLRNRFAHDNERAYISVIFDDGHGSKWEMEDSIEKSFLNNPISTQFIRETAFASDFLNYKYLSALFDFDNSQPNEVFGIFRKHILPFLNLEDSRKNQDGSDSMDSNAANWYNWLLETLPTLPKVTGRPSLIAKTEELSYYKKQLTSFNDYLEKEINDIIFDANRQLRENFKHDVQLVCAFKPASIDTHGGGKFHNPEILIHARMTHSLVKNSSDIEHPKSFFNEAKITSMALAIRLAVLNRRAFIESAASVLFLDDMLISLDMSLRQMVLPMLLEYTKQHQLFIFTHDRTTYNLVQQIVVRNEGLKQPDGRVLDRYGKWDKNWRSYEMFVKETPSGPESIFKQKASYLERAQAHFRSFQIPECANALRQCCEAKIKELISNKYWYAINKSTGQLQDATLSNLIQDFESERKRKGFPDIAPSIDGDRQRILNPFSHDDIYTPYYIGELKTALESMERLDKVRRIIITHAYRIGDNIRPYSFECTKTTEAGEEYKAGAQFCFMEYFDVWEYEGKCYPGNPEVRLLGHTGNHKKFKQLKVGEKYPLNKIYDIVRTAVSASREPIHTELIDHATGSTLEI